MSTYMCVYIFFLYISIHNMRPIGRRRDPKKRWSEEGTGWSSGKIFTCRHRAVQPEGLLRVIASCCDSGVSGVV